MTSNEVERHIRDLRTATAMLASTPDAQQCYLRNLGIPGIVDELALRFNDSFLIIPELQLRDALSTQAEQHLRAINIHLSEMTESTFDLWSEESLIRPQWRQLRKLAQEALALIPGSGG